MNYLTLDELKILAQQTHNPSISIFLPMERAGQEVQQNPIRFKNMLQEAEQRFETAGMKPREIGALLESGHNLLNDLSFWEHQQDGLAVFIANNDFHYYRLPFPVDEQMVIARTYYVKPILPLFTNNGHYYILAISQNDARLFEATRHTIGQIDLPQDTPQSLEEALRYDDPEKQLQFHSGTAQGSAGSGSRAAMFHGQGANEDAQKERIEQYLNLLDTSLQQIFRQQNAPLVLAGVDYLLPIYRKVSDYPHIMADGIEGNPDTAQPETLQADAWAIVEPHFRKDLDSVIETYQQLANSEQATDDLDAIVAAAFYGRVDKLILSVDTQAWGTFDADTGAVIQHQEGQRSVDDLPLLDFAAMQTLQNSGAVYALSAEDMPVDASVLAVLRY